MSAMPAVADHGDAAAGHHLDRPTKLRQFRMLVQLLIVSDAVFVAAMFFSYLYLRALNVNNMWLPAKVHPVGAAASWSIAGLMVVSAVVYRWGDLGGRAGRRGRQLAGLAVAMLIVLAELVLQIQQLASTGFGAGDGAYASNYYAMAGYHAVHLVLLLLLGLGITIRAARGVYRSGDYNEVSLLGYWWYWVAFTAIAMAVLPH